jgi:predicted GNAT family N-acyltransferase
MKLLVAAFGSSEQLQAVELRRDVLRTPLGLDFTPEELAAEQDDLHLVALDPDVVACLVLTRVDEVRMKMRQVAVDPHRQGGGVGSQLVRFSEEVARERGYREMVLNARETAVPFYLRLGYRQVGERFEEVTIPHFKMRLLL